MRAEYDFSNAVRGKYYGRFHAGSNLVLLEPDVSAAFPDAASVNQALWLLATTARRSTGVMRPARAPRKARAKTKRRD